VQMVGGGGDAGEPRKEDGYDVMEGPSADDARGKFASCFWIAAGELRKTPDSAGDGRTNRVLG
jgi:hypothetical protein